MGRPLPASPSTHPLCLHTLLNILCDNPHSPVWWTGWGIRHARACMRKIAAAIQPAEASPRSSGPVVSSLMRSSAGSTNPPDSAPGKVRILGRTPFLRAGPRPLTSVSRLLVRSTRPARQAVYLPAHAHLFPSGPMGEGKDAIPCATMTTMRVMLTRELEAIITLFYRYMATCCTLFPDAWPMVAATTGSPCQKLVSRCGRPSRIDVPFTNGHVGRASDAMQLVPGGFSCCRIWSSYALLRLEEDRPSGSQCGPHKYCE